MALFLDLWILLRIFSDLLDQYGIFDAGNRLARTRNLKGPAIAVVEIIEELPDHPQFSAFY
ncbi:MAG: hypothetical protein JZU63_01020 [Rhodoferax sp.]|nr:hypothetical protein [Rhodoferax sp.]